MPPAAGTVHQLHHVTGIPVRTLQRWAAIGALKPVDRVRTGKRWTARYDAVEAMRLGVSRRHA